MLAAQAEHGFEDWRILLFAKNGAELLVLKRALGLCLPVLRVPRDERIARSLNAEAQRSWNLETVCVAPITIPLPDRASGDARYYIMEVRRPEELSRIAPKTVDVATLKPHAFSDTRDFQAVRRAMKLEANATPPDHDGPFSDFAAFQRISEWVREQLKLSGRQWDGSFRQLHADGFFSLIRFQTNPGAVWFKATGEPNRREFAITRRLSALFPQFLPEIVSVHADWNAWLTNEVPGTSLQSSADLSSWCLAAESVAELQVASIAHTSSILDSRAHDSRTTTLLSEAVPWFAEIENLMERQIKAAPQRLSATEVRSLRQRVIDALTQLESAAIPDALNHFDLNPANAIVGTGECRFLDWAEASVGNPFFSFEYLRQHFLRAFSGDLKAATKVRDSYAKVWRRLLSASVIDLAIELMPLVAPFAFAAITLPSNGSDGNREPQFAGFLRSLARRMHREAEQLGKAA